MKVAIASDGKNAEDNISDICARAPFFQIYEDGELVEVIDNPFKSGGGAGASVAKMLEDKECNALVCSRFGGNIVEWLDEREIRHVEFEGKVSEALEEIEDAEAEE